MKDKLYKKDRGFYILSQSWYAEANMRRRKPDFVDDVMFGIYPEDGTEGTYGEMTMIWRRLGNNIVPQLHIFDDAWRVLASFTDLIKQLAVVDGQNITVEQFTNILKSCGFKDLTKRENPYT